MGKHPDRVEAVGVRPGPELIIESSHDAIMAVTRLGLISACNPAATRLYGYPADELVGRPVTLLTPSEWQADESDVLRRILAGEELEPFSSHRIRRDGTEVLVSAAVSPILDHAGVVVGASTSERLLAEQSDAGDGLKPLKSRPAQARTASDGKYPAGDRVTEADNRADDVQDRFHLRMDAERAKERVRVNLAQDRFQVRMGEERAQERLEVEEAHAQFQAVMDADRVRERVQILEAQDRFQVRMRDERAAERVEVEEAHVQFQAVMTAERAKERVQILEAQDRFQLKMSNERAQERILAEDAHDDLQVRMDAERAQAQNDREHLQGQLHQGQRLEVLGQLAGGVAHDFNNLLAVILNYAAFVVEELAAGPEGDLAAAGRDVAQIQRAAERATALTHQLLAFARREVVQPRVLDLNHVVTEVQQLLERTIGTDVVLHTDLAPDLWPVLADAGQIEQILVNLAVNARDAMIDGGVLSIDTANIVVGAEFIAAGSLVRAGNHVRLRIGDTGSGMSPDVMAHVFEPFYTTKADGSGTGLGLATVYGIVIQAEGTIRIQSQAGLGTTFTILIPVTDQVAVPIEEETPYQRTPTGETVLIVEDEEALREVTRRIFTRGGYQVITAAHGAEALAVAAEYDGDIHLLVTDVVMPNMLGKEVVERMLQIKPNIEVLYMSGYAQPVLASQGRLDQDAHLIEKPFSSATLIAKAGQILNGHFGPHTDG
ncbi:MAG: ATP-binding protein [Actinoplanes sp.]